MNNPASSGDCSRCTTPCDDQVICHCLRVTEATILAALTTQSVRNIKDLRACTGAGQGCMACVRKLKRYIELHVCCQTNAVLENENRPGTPEPAKLAS